LSNQQETLRAAINTGLVSLGEPIMKTIIWHLHSRGFSIESKNIDIALFYDHLHEIVGNTADIVLEEVYTNLKRQYSSHTKGHVAGHANHHDSIQNKANYKDHSIIYKIQQLENSDASESEGFSR
jgi:molybdenum cofactor biosynthesis enzyme